MPSTEISDLTAVTAVVGTHEFAVNEGGAATKKVTATQLSAFMQSLEVGHRKIVRLTADHSINSVTATEVTGLSTTLVAGTYLFEYFLLLQTSATGTGVSLGIEFTGTETRLSFSRRFVTNATGTISSVMASAINVAAGSMTCGYANTAASTTTPNTQPTGGAVSADADCLNMIEGIIVVSNGGDLELWCGSETAATAVSVEQESCLIVTRLV